MYDDLIKTLRLRAALWEKMYDEDNVLKQAADAIEELLQKVQQLPRWIPVTERLPENDAHVLLSCKCGASAYVCDGFHTEKYSKPTQFYEDIDADYDEETDEYYSSSQEISTEWYCVEDMVENAPTIIPAEEGE